VIDQLLRPWRTPATWQHLGHVALGPILGTASFTVVITLLAVTLGLLITFPLALPFAWLLFIVARGFSHLQRSRFASLVDVPLADPVEPLPEEANRRTRFVAKAKSGPRWREIGHALLALPLSLLAFVVASVTWAGSIVLLSLPVWVGILPGDTAKFWLFEVGQGPASLAFVLVGLVGLVVVAPRATAAMVELDVAAAGWLIGPSLKDALRAQVGRVETSRVAAVDAAEAERRRIERDLHDGAQQRLVALAMDLGAARERIDRDPEAGRALLDSAHEEAKAALGELRDLVRGIHPAILEEQGIDAALSAVVARCPVPVEVHVDIADRPRASVESTAYYVVTESLTNVARHAQASRAWVSVIRLGDRLTVEVRDDGVGGADPERGTGLRGLTDRATGLGGTCDVISPAGGPTTLLVVLPCG
jgi:signal transduction histidine kinase